MLNREKLIIAGSPARILNSNYFNRKVEVYKKNFDVILVMDSYIFHDKKENILKLSSNEKIVKNVSNEEWETFTETKVQQCSDIIKGFKLRKWNHGQTSRSFINFIKLLNPTSFCVDITKCPICNEPHVGPFKVDNETILCKNERIPIKDINHLNCRIKHGYLQLYLAKVLKCKVLLSNKFYQNNISLVKKLNLQKYVLIDVAEKAKVIALNDYIDNFFETVKIPYSVKHILRIFKFVGLRKGMLVIKREICRKHKDYVKADKIREMLCEKDIKIEDGKNLSYLIIKRRKK